MIRAMNWYAGKIFVVIIIIFIHFSEMGICQCTTVGPNGASSFGNDATLGSLAWNNPANAETSNNQYATAGVLLSAMSSINSEYLSAEGFGFNIPAGATICGIQVDVQGFASGITGALGITLGTITDNSVKIIKNGTIAGSEHASPSNWSGTNGYNTYGGAFDTWGVSSWQPSDINATNFGVAISTNILALVAAVPTANIDYIRITISYLVVPLAASLQNFKVIEGGNTLLILWTAQPENYLDFSVQRSADTLNWVDMAAVQARVGQEDYEVTDRDPLNGGSFYRIQFHRKDGSLEYSSSQFVFLNKGMTPSIYPNPATSDLWVRASTPMQSLIIYDLQGRQIKKYSAYSASGTLHLDVSTISPGVYFVEIDGSMYKLIKR
jgi:hypothetical protein